MKAIWAGWMGLAGFGRVIAVGRLKASDPFKRRTLCNFRAKIQGTPNAMYRTT